MNWKYWVMMKMKPSSVKNETVTAAQAALKRAFLNSVTSSIGSRALRSQAMKAASSPTPNANPTTLRRLPQP
jgi:hypothetical protein